MKFQITQKNLNNCLKDVSLFVDRGHQLDTIKNINLKTKKNLMEVSATNLEISIIEKIQGSCKKDGEISISPDTLKNYIQTIPESEIITLEVEESKLKIIRQKSEVTINGLLSDNPIVFPVISKTKPVLKLKTSQLKQIISQVVFATTKDLNRPVLTSCILNVFNKELYLAATDSYRLAEKKIEGNLVKHSLADDTQILIPATTLINLERCSLIMGIKKSPFMLIKKINIFCLFSAMEI